MRTARRGARSGRRRAVSVPECQSECGIRNGRDEPCRWFVTLLVGTADGGFLYELGALRRFNYS